MMSLKKTIKAGEALFKKGNITEARNLFENLLKDNPSDYEVLNNLGVVCHASGNIQRAEEYFLKVLEIRDDYLDARINLAELYDRAERWMDARRELEKCIDMDDRSADLFQWLGMVYVRMGETQKAIGALKHSLEINPDQDVVKRALATIETANVSPGKDKKREIVGAAVEDERNRENNQFPNETVSDIYLKQVPPEKRHLKTGMNICIIADLNIAGLLTSLMRAINKYSEHKARCIIWHNDHFSYDKDIILDECNGNFDEACEIVKKTDFFHFGRYIFNFPGVEFNKILNPRNCVVKYYGTFLRKNYKAINEWHRKTGIAAITGDAYKITGLSDRSFYHLGSYFTKFGDMDEKDIPLAEEPDGVIRIVAGSAGAASKRYDLLEKAISELQGEGLPVDVDLIAGVSNEECLKRKQKGHITFSSLTGGWGISGVESMWMGHPVMSCIDPFSLSLYPDQPTVIIDQSNYVEEIKRLVTCPEKISEIGRCSRAFVKRHFRTKDILRRYLYIFDQVMNHDDYLQGGLRARRIYTF